MQENASETSTALDLVKTAFSSLKKLLGVFGVSVGIGALISQVRELAQAAGDAGKAYGKMYNQIYYTVGELSDSQKELAETLALEFDKTDVAETISRISTLFPAAETTLMESGETALESLSRELLWLDAKGFGDVSTMITENLLAGMGDSFEQAESASQTYAESMETVGRAAAASSDGFATLASGIDGLA